MLKKNIKMSSEEDFSEDDLQAIISDETEKEQAAELAAKNLKREKSPNSEEVEVKRDKKDDAAVKWKKSDYEKQLEKLIFGDKTSLLENLKESARGETNKVDDEKPKRKPAWHDSDDEEVHIGDVVRENKWTGSLQHLDKEKKYSELLKSKFNRLQAPPKWADLDRERDVDSDEEILQTVGHLAHTSSANLPPNTVQHKRLKDLNRATYAEGGITAIQFHPTSTVAVVAGYAGIASIYSIDGIKNDKLHNVRFQNFPIKCAKLLPSGAEAIIGGSKNFFYSYDLMLGEATRVFLPKVMTKLHKFEISPCGKYVAACGRFGEVHLLDTRSKELLHTFKQENPCTAMQFTGDSRKIIAHSSGPDVSIFDLRQEKIEHVFFDDGCISGKKLSLSPNGRMLATGSNEGVVNIYNYSDVLSVKTPQPQKIIYNLTTSISDMKFNCSSELLGICSDSVLGAMKLIHFPTATTFANFPGQQANVGTVRVLEFSPSSGFLALGNSVKEVPLFRLKHFKNY